jgi:hypothetical protein
LFETSGIFPGVLFFSARKFFGNISKTGRNSSSNCEVLTWRKEKAENIGVFGQRELRLNFGSAGNKEIQRSTLGSSAECCFSVRSAFCFLQTMGDERQF